MIMEAGGGGKRDVLLLRYNNEQIISAKEQSRVDDNYKHIQNRFAKGNISDVMIEMRSSRRVNVASQNTVAAISTFAHFGSYKHVILDISATPRVIALTAIAKLLTIFDDLKKSNPEKAINLHVVVTESHQWDQRIHQENLDEDVVPLRGFSGRLDAEATREVPRVWLPVLGESAALRLNRIYTYLQPDEICPVIPSPALNPRRGDSLIEEYRQLLLDTFQVEPRNILYASEYNPFEAYRQLIRTITRYGQALKSLGGCKAFVSPLSSKLLSVGALLACYELRQKKLNIGIPLVESQLYRLDDESTEITDMQMYEMWLTGECYE
jgi:hypothetical protein